MYVVVAPLNIEEHWPVAAPWIAQAVGASDTWKDLDEIKMQCKNGYSHLWLGRNPTGELYMVLVTETWLMGGRKTLVLRWLSGCYMEDWINDYPLIENWAINNGFQDIHVWGRKGFEKICKPLGLEHQFTVMGKPLIRGLH